MNTQSQPSSFLAVIASFFVGILIISNIASSAKIVDFGVSIFSIPLAFDGGTILFPIAYILGDLLTEVYGYKASRRVIWTGFIVLCFCSLLFFLLRALPGEATWESYAGSQAYDAILGGMSSGGIAAASLSGYMIGSFSNSAILSRLKVLMKGKALWVRAMASSLAGQLLDSFAFVSVACLTGVFGCELFATLALTNYLFKLAVEVIIFPLTFLTAKKLKKHEGIDTFDVGVRLNPFGRD